MKITFAEYRIALKSAVDHATGGTYDWSGVTQATWNRWFAAGYWIDEILDERLTPPAEVPDDSPPAKQPGNFLYWFVGGFLALAIGALVLVSAIFNDSSRSNKGPPLDDLLS